jgi:phenylacetyl-CoA:acceptor oxidoreductase 26-kDa subunit
MMSRLQASWDARAATNFMLGGAGAGLIVFSSFVRNPYALALGLVLVAAGLGAVWLEIGRKLRAVHVFFNPFTSWMTREAFAAVIVFAGGVSFLAFQQQVLLHLTAVAALAFLYCQARILRAAKGIPAWRAPEVVPLIVFSGLAEGAGLALFFGLDPMFFVAALLPRAYSWHRYRAAVKSSAFPGCSSALLWAGTVLPLALLLLAGPVAGLLAVATGAWLKLALVTRASFNQGFALPHLPVRGAR